jgi:hypothetical protein
MREKSTERMRLSSKRERERELGGEGSGRRKDGKKRQREG